MLSPARAAMSRTRAPLNPFAPNSSAAASSSCCRARSGSRRRSAWLGDRLVATRQEYPPDLIRQMHDKFIRMHDNELHVLVIGGGIGGLCLAHGLRRARASVAVYERTRTRTDWLQGY